jgi:hypothetical protein
MSGTTGAQRQWGEGPLARTTALVYNLLIVELLLLLTTLPGVVPLLLLLDRDASNLPLAAAGLLPVGPAVSAALYALHRRSADLADLHPARAFWRGYRMNAKGALLLWVPWLAWMTVIAVNLANLPAAGVDGGWAVPLVVIAVAATLWVVNALVITSLFAFRARDVARLAVYFLIRTWAVTLGTAGLLIIAAGVTAVATEAVLALLGSVFAAALLRTSRPLITATTEEFTA